MKTDYEIFLDILKEFEENPEEKRWELENFVSELIDMKKSYKDQIQMYKDRLKNA